jgi:hypothetical protein
LANLGHLKIVIKALCDVAGFFLVGDGGTKWKNIGHNIYSFYGVGNPNQKNLVFGFKKHYCV